MPTGWPAPPRTRAARSSSRRCTRARPPLVALREAGVPVYREIEAAACGTRPARGRRPNEPPRGVPELPGARSRRACRPRLLGGARAARRGGDRLSPPARRVGGTDEALAAAAELGYPVVLKALGLLHKSDAGGVALGIEDERALEARWQKWQHCQPKGTRSSGWRRVAEGARADRRLPSATRASARSSSWGSAGSTRSFSTTSRSRSLPSTQRRPRSSSVRSAAAAILAGARGRPPLDVRAAAESIAALSRLAAAHPELAEIEINPLLVTPSGALALDARALSVENGADAR